jgi:hypothetical protein
MVEHEDCHRSPRSPDPIVCSEGWSWGGPSQQTCLRNSDYANLTTTDGVPIDLGIVVGASVSCGVGGGGTAGIEQVFDLYDLEVETFGFGGFAGVIGGSVAGYVGIVKGWSSYKAGGVQNYRGFAGSLAASLGIGSLFVQGGVSQKIPKSESRLWVGALGIGASLGAKVNGKLLESVLDKLGKIPGLPSGGVANYFTVDDVSAKISQLTGVDTHLPTTQRIFHAHNKRPTYADAVAFTAYIAKLSLDSPVIASLAPLLSGVALYNARAWQDAETLRKSP